MSEYGNTYYPEAIIADFSSVKSIAQLSALGLNVAPGRIGGINKDDKITSCRSDPANVRFTSDGTVQLVVPCKFFACLVSASPDALAYPTGGQKMGGAITGAQIRSAEYMTSGHLTMRTRVSPVHGTCQALFTYIDETNVPKAGDEQDIEIRPRLMDKGIQLTNWNQEYVFVCPIHRNPNLSRSLPVRVSSSYHMQSVGTWEPFPSEPTTAFHNYTIFWPPADLSPRQTSHYFNGQLLKTFDKYVSVNPSSARLSNWSNGQLSFTQGPPVSDSVLDVELLAYYYSTAQVPGLPSGCTTEQACRV
jgi:hypothetical protein